MPVEPHVLHVFSSSGLYGAEHAVLGMMPALAEHGVTSTLACIDNPHLREQPLYEHARANGLDAERIPCTKRLDSATTAALRAMALRRPGTVVHVHGYKGAFYAARVRGKNPAPAMVSTLHGWVTTTARLRFYRWLELRALRRFERACIVSAAMRTTLLRAGIEPRRIRLIENGINTTRFHAQTAALSRSELGIPDDAFVFGAVLRLSPEKNPLGLLDAFVRGAAKTSHAHLVVAGDGPQRELLARRAHQAGVADRVHLLGARDDPERLYPLFDCFVLASLTEGLPLVLLEAMACERPIIATRVGQVAAVLESLPARLLDAGDTDALAAAMHDALDRHPPVPLLRERVTTRYSIARMARDYAGMYRELVNERGRLAA